MDSFSENIDRAINVFDEIKQALILKDQLIPEGTPVEEYKNKILAVTGTKLYIGDYTSVSEFIGTAIRKINSGKFVIGIGAIDNWQSSLLNVVILNAQPDSNTMGVSWSPDGRYLSIKTQNSITIYDFISGTPQKMANPSVLPTGIRGKVSWSPDGRYLAVSHSEYPFITIYDFISGTPQKMANPSVLPTAESANMSWSPDGRYLAVSHSGNPFITIYDFISGTPQKMANPSVLPNSHSKDVSWSPNGRYLGVVHEGDIYITVYDWLDGTPKKINMGTTKIEGAFCLKWSPDGNYLVIGCNYQYHTRLKCFDFRSGNPSPIKEINNIPANNVNALDFTFDGQYLVTSIEYSPFMYIYKWDSSDPINPIRISNPSTLPNAASKSTAWSPDGRYLAVGINAQPYIIIYDTLADMIPKIMEPTMLELSAYWNQSVFKGFGICLEDIDEGEEGKVYILWEK